MGCCYCQGGWCIDSEGPVLEMTGVAQMKLGDARGARGCSLLSVWKGESSPQDLLLGWGVRSDLGAWLGS
jgi:hypothetical protein